MAHNLRPVAVTMSHPAEWLALLRIVVGLYFVKSLVTKMTLVMLGGVLPVPVVSPRWLEVMPKIVAKQASENPIGFYKHFLETTVLPNSNLFAQLTAWGETVVGIGLTLGLLTGAGIAGGPGSGDELRAGDAVDVSRAAGLPSGAVLPHAGVLSCPGGTHLGTRWLAGPAEACGHGWRGGRFPDTALPAVHRLPPHSAHYSVRLAVGITRAVDQTEHPIRLPAIVPETHGDAVLARKPGRGQIIGVKRDVGVHGSGPLRAGHTAPPSGWRRFPSSPRLPARVARSPVTNTVSLRIVARQAGDPLLLGGQAGFCHISRSAWPASWLNRNEARGPGVSVCAGSSRTGARQTSAMIPERSEIWVSSASGERAPRPGAPRSRR